jgi:hypothetical protein
MFQMTGRIRSHAMNLAQFRPASLHPYSPSTNRQSSTSSKSQRG